MKPYDSTERMEKLMKKKMMRNCTALMLVMVLAFSLVGCGIFSDGHVVKAAIPKEDASNEENLKTWIKKGEALSTQSFDEKTMVEFLSGGENGVYSPTNAYIALAMLAEACDGETREEILKLLGSDDMTALREKAQAMWNANYIDDENATKIANSIWLNEQIKFRKELLDTYANSYYASTFFGKMGTSEMDELLRKWVNENTGHQLENETKNIETNQDTLVEILSTIFFQSKWTDRNKFMKESTSQKAFSGKSGTKNVMMMRTSFEGEVYETEQFAACDLELTQGKMTFFKPKKGVEIDDILKSGSITETLHRHETGVNPDGTSTNYDYVDVSVPKFEIHGGIEMIEGLEKLGIEKVFAPETAEMGNLLDKTETKHKPYVSRIQHDAMVELDEEGVTAAPYTEITVTDGATPMMTPSVYNFNLDEPFLYAITGNDGSLLFVGTVYDVE